jgi:hypothetical protein
MIQKNCKHYTYALAIAWLLFAAPIAALADLGEGQMTFTHNLEAIFKRANFNNDYYTGVLALPGPGSGEMHSQATHGFPDHKVFPATTPWDERTASSAAGETTSQRMVYRSNTDPGVSVTVYVPATDPYSDSEAAYIGTDTRESLSQSSTMVVERVGLSRKGLGSAPNSNFFIEVNSPLGTAHLLAMHTGNAFGDATVTASLTGKLEDAATGIPPVNLPSIQLFSKHIGSNDAWDSPDVSGNYFFDLPDWTRLSDASFILTIGLKVTSSTYAFAQSVPEPTSLSALGLGLALLTLRRRGR